MEAALQSSRTGDLLNGSYELHEKLAAASEHDTYRATDVRRGSAVQVTLLKPELALRAGAVDRFLELPRKLATLRHPNIAQTVGIELDETGIPFVVEEHVEGDPLAETFVGFPQGMPLGVAMTVLGPVIDAVAAAHAKGLVHGRLSRDQVLLVRAGGSSVPKLMGLGRAPEGADASSDVWAIGALLYEALGGQSAGRPGKPRAALDELAPHLPAELVTLIEACLARDPSARPEDARSVSERLSKLTGGMRGERKAEPGAERRTDPRAEPPEPRAARSPAPTAARKPDPRAEPAGPRSPDARAEAATTSARRPDPRAEAATTSARSPDARAEAATTSARRPDLRAQAATTNARKPDPRAEPASARKPDPRAEPDVHARATPLRPSANEAPKPLLPAAPPKTPVVPPPRSEAPPRRLHAAAEDPTVPVEPTPIAKPSSKPPTTHPAEAATLPDALPLALDKTMAAQEQPAALKSAIERARAQAEAEPEVELGFDLASESETAVEEPLAAGAADDDDDGPELSFEAPAHSAPPQTVAARRSKRPPAEREVKNANDLAAAFAPIEGSERIGQTETAEAAMVRSFKQSFEEAQVASAKQRKVARSAAAVAAAAGAKEEPSGPSPKSRKELRDGTPRPIAKSITDDEIKRIRQIAGEEKRDDDSLVGMLVFLLFVFLLPFATPVLCDPTTAPKLIEGKLQIAAGAFAVLTTVALIRTWALQIRAAPTLMKPVTTTLKIVTAAVIVLAVSFFLPTGALGPVHRYARAVLPWAASGFYVFLALHGLARAVREAGQGALRAVGMTVVYLSAFFGSYHVLTKTVLMQAKAQRAKNVQGVEATTGVVGLDNLLGSSKVELPDAGITPDKPMAQRKEVGASEADDMAAVNELSNGNQKKGKQLSDFSKKIGTIMK